MPRSQGRAEIKGTRKVGEAGIVIESNHNCDCSVATCRIGGCVVSRSQIITVIALL